MNWTKECEILNQIAGYMLENGLSEDILCEPTAQESSYYQEHIQENDIAEYGFGTVVELKSLLEDLWKDEVSEKKEKLFPPVLVAAFKNRPQFQNKKKVDIHENKTVSPVSMDIYEF